MGVTVAKKKRSGSGFGLGLVIGLAVGATLAWVLLPQPGEVDPLATMTSRARTSGGNSASDAASASDRGATAADGAEPTLVDVAMAAVERVRGRWNDAMALGREAYEQGQVEVKQRFNQARTAE